MDEPLVKSLRRALQLGAEVTFEPDLESRRTWLTIRLGEKRTQTQVGTLDQSGFETGIDGGELARAIDKLVQVGC